MMASCEPRIVGLAGIPPLPPAGQVVLVRLDTPTTRIQAQAKSRAVLRGILSCWSGLESAGLPLLEDLRGPMWRGRLAGESLGISFSYGERTSWIGLLRGGRIGVDVVTARTFAEMALVARDFLGPTAADDCLSSANPARAFALAWAELEARRKCVKRGLPEPGEREPVDPGISIWKRILDDDQAVAVATAKQDSHH